MTLIEESRTEFDRTRFFIDGEWVAPQGTEQHTALEAHSEEVIGVASLGTEADIDAAVRAARRALDEGPWGRTTAEERAQVMERFAAALSERADATSTLVSRENGMPITLSNAFNGAAPAGLLQMYAQIARQTDFESVRPSLSGATIVRREPVGVVAAITPWNYPQVLAMMKIAPALAAGCTIVLKPSPETALDTYVFADAAQEAGLPPGVLNIVLAGREAGAALVSHPLVDKVAFTGSTAAGRTIGAECGRLIRRVTLELGGKSAAIVLDDADMDTFLANLDGASFMNNGQTCTTQSRILAPRSRYAEVTDALADYCRGLVVGNPLEESTTLGPMASETHLARVNKYIEIGKASGARLITGGSRPAGLDRGWFVEPTVFADVDNGDQLAREEVFGPVYAVMPYDTEEEAIAIANDSEYGLGGSVWTTDEGRGIDVARKVRTGTIGVNYYQLDLGSPFGGMKASGIGRELGPEALNNYLEYKSVFVSADQLA
ncbi:aldehyde dehydrogenase [Klenkia brasiliensis]|uniref:Betaine-aldehyde dehydrogenase n=1 Tax=Klenkia brasiliensis TaxID=333142 RepID=A0A1G7USR6_9ACTN|nr:aldehyde dehydrogenase [Klenkia brasiliensis]SDG50159.1 betaine-aldehyde dehydrogenase [Klenkia brasiliensis]